MSQVIYLMSGSPHCPYLVVSLATLRNHYGGPVKVYAYPNSIDIVSQIADDQRLKIEVVPYEPKYKDVVPRKNLQFVEKISILSSTDQTTLYLDADTSVHRDIRLAIQLAERFGFVTTQFNNWQSNSGIPRKRVARLEEFPEIDQELVRRTITFPFPSVNGGIVAAQADSPVLKTWLEWTLIAKDIFIADETVLHLMVPKYQRLGKLAVLMGGNWNSSPKWPPPNPDGIHVRHYHGDLNVRPNKSPAGVEYWGKLFDACLEQNVGFVNDWWRDADNKFLNGLREKVI